MSIILYLKRRSIARQLSLTVAISIIFIFVVLSVSFYCYVSNQLIERIKSDTSLRAESVSKDINSIFKEAKVITIQTSNNMTVRNYLKSITTRSQITTNPLYEDTLKTLKGAQVTNNMYNAVWAGNEEVSFYLDSNKYITDTNYQVKARPWYEIAMKTKGVAFTSPYIDYSTKKMVLSTVISVIENNKRIGFVGIDVFLSSIPQILSSAKIGQKGKIFLLTNDGDYIYNDGKPIKEMENILAPTDVLRSTALKILNGEGMYDEVMYDREKYYVIYYPVSQTGWIVVSLVNKYETIQDLIQFSWILSVSICIAIITLFSIITRIVNKHTKPLGVITSYAEEIAAGDFERNLPESFLREDNEVGDLSRAFQTITEAFRRENVTLETKIQEKNKELEQQYRYMIETEKMASLGELVAGVAHEINTPLGIGITTVSYLQKINMDCRRKLADGTMVKSDLQNFIEEINDSVEIIEINLARAAKLVSSFKKVAVDQTNESLITFSLLDTIEIVLLSLKHAYKNTKHKITYQCPSEMRLTSYPGAFSQILTNLIMNSLTHGFRDIKEGQINISAYIENEVFILNYSDNGNGISEEHIKKIFEPFFTTNRAGGGSGLGLYLVYNIVTQQLKGTIKCESSHGQGVKMLIEIPKGNIMNP